MTDSAGSGLRSRSAAFRARCQRITPPPVPLSGRYSAPPRVRRSVRPRVTRRSARQRERGQVCLAAQPTARTLMHSTASRCSSATICPTCSACTPRAIRFQEAADLGPHTRLRHRRRHHRRLRPHPRFRPHPRSAQPPRTFPLHPRDHRLHRHPECASRRVPGRRSAWAARVSPLERRPRLRDRPRTARSKRRVRGPRHVLPSFCTGDLDVNDQR